MQGGATLSSMEDYSEGIGNIIAKKLREAANVSSGFVNPGKIGPDGEERLHSALVSTNNLLNSSKIEDAEWSLISAISQPAWAGASPRCQEACTQLLYCIVRACSPREMFTVLMEALQSAVPKQTGGMSFGDHGEDVERTVDDPMWALPLSILQAFATVVGRIERRQENFFEEASTLLEHAARRASEDKNCLAGNATDLSTRSATALNTKVNTYCGEIFSSVVSVVQAAAAGGAILPPARKQRLCRSIILLCLRLLTVLPGDTPRADPSSEPGDPTSFSCPPHVSSILALLHDCNVSLPELLDGTVEQLLEEENARASALGGGQEDADQGVDEECDGRPEGSLNAARECQLAKQGAGIAAFWIIQASACLNAPDDQHLSQSQLLAGVTLAEHLLRDSARHALWGVALLEALSQSRQLDSSEDQTLVRVGSPEAAEAFSTLETLVEAITESPSLGLRRQFYFALQLVIRQLLAPQLRFEALLHLVKCQPHAMLVALLLGMAKEEYALASLPEKDLVSMPAGTAPTTACVLQIVQQVLAPPGCGPPEFPEDSEAVLGALNLYRFILLREQAGGKNSEANFNNKTKLLEVRRDWLLPLRQLTAQASSAAAEGCRRNVSGEEAAGIAAVERVQMVLHRCLELTEEALVRLLPKSTPHPLG